MLLFVSAIIITPCHTDFFSFQNTSSTARNCFLPLVGCNCRLQFEDFFLLFMIVGYFDGACEPKNPGGSIGIGAILFDAPNAFIKNNLIYLGDGFTELFSYAGCFHKGERSFIQTSNNVAEYCACLMLTTYLNKNKLYDEHIILCGDSKLVVNQMNKEWGMNKGIYIPYVLDVLKSIELFVNLKFVWIPREYNDIADELSKSKMIERGVKFKIQPINK